MVVKEKINVVEDSKNVMRKTARRLDAVAHKYKCEPLSWLADGDQLAAIRLQVFVLKVMRAGFRNYWSLNDLQVWLDCSVKSAQDSRCCK